MVTSDRAIAGNLCRPSAGMPAVGHHCFVTPDQCWQNATGPSVMGQQRLVLHASNRATAGSRHCIGYGSQLWTCNGPLIFAEWVVVILYHLFITDNSFTITDFC